jgi:hypothetical protein
MASRRTSDSQDSSRPLPPPVVAEKKPVKRAAAAPLSAAAVAPPVAAAVAAATTAKSKKPRAGVQKKQAVITATPVPTVSEDERRGMIARAAYLRGQSRGFPPGGEAEDWLAAEKEIEALLSGSSGATQ